MARPPARPAKRRKPQSNSPVIARLENTRPAVSRLTGTRPTGGRPNGPKRTNGSEKPAKRKAASGGAAATVLSRLVGSMAGDRHWRPYASVLDTIGWTPLIRLFRITRGVQDSGLREGGVFQSWRVGRRIGSAYRSSSGRNERVGSGLAVRSSKARAATRAWVWRWRLHSRATDASSRCPTRCRRRRCVSSRRSGRR